MNETIIKVKPIINKSNGQVNVSLPKKLLSKYLNDNMSKIKSMKIKIEDFDLW